MAENKETDITWAIKLLTSDDEKERGPLSRYAGTVLAGTAGLLSAFYVNFASGRPLFSGIQKHIAFPLIFGAAARWYEIRAADNLAGRDAVLRHYITLHPEDFPEPERKKFSEVLNNWVPIR